jgi:nucleoside phosphorylase
LADDASLEPLLVRPPKAIVGGDFASGNLVVDSTTKRNKLLELNRWFQAVETEAAGMMQAIHSAVGGAGAFVVRGLSDWAAGKSELDKESKGAFRELAARSAAEFVHDFIRWGPVPPHQNANEKRSKSLGDMVRRGGEEERI